MGIVKTVKLQGPKGEKDVVIVNEGDEQEWIDRGYKLVPPPVKVSKPVVPGPATGNHPPKVGGP